MQTTLCAAHTDISLACVPLCLEEGSRGPSLVYNEDSQATFSGSQQTTRGREVLCMLTIMEHVQAVSSCKLAG